MPKPESTAWTVRPPWPDEAVRLGKHFNVWTPLASARALGRWVIEAGEPERIVGVAILTETSPAPKPGAPTVPELRLAWEVRAAWQDRPAAEALLDAALTAARQSTVPRLVMTVVPDKALAALALRKGFEELSREEVWEVPVGAALVNLEDRGSQIIALTPLPISPIGQANLERVKKICAATTLLTPERVVPCRPGVAGGFDPGLSFFAGDPDQPAAVLLGREQLGKAYLEVLARNPDVKDLPLAGVLGLLRAFFRAAAALGMDQVSCAVRPDSLPGLVPVARRSGGKRQEAIAVVARVNP